MDCLENVHGASCEIFALCSKLNFFSIAQFLHQVSCAPMVAGGGFIAASASGGVTASTAAAMVAFRLLPLPNQSMANLLTAAAAKSWCRDPGLWTSQSASMADFGFTEFQTVSLATLLLPLLVGVSLPLLPLQWWRFGCCRFQTRAWRTY